MDYPLLDIFLTTMWVFLWVLWFMLLFRVFADGACPRRVDTGS